VDYLEEMRSRKGLSDWESVRENARGLKQQARVSRIPHVTGTQINRDGDTAHQSIHKIADAIIQLYPDDDDEKIMLYRLLKYRDGPSQAPR
jgi:replicative DNA helicase